MAGSVQKNTIIPQKLTLKEKFSYGTGDIGFGFMFDLGQIYLLKFYTDVLGLPVAVAGLVFLVTKIWDAFADISIGTWIDNRKKIGPKGKFRPFILYATIPLAIITIISFITPSFTITGKIIWAYVTYMAFGSIYSVGNIAFGSMIPAMTTDPNERTQLASFRQAGSNMALFITTIAFMPIVMLFSNKSTGYMVAVSIFAILGVLLQIYCYSNIKERNVVQKPKIAKGSILKSYKGLFKNTPLLILCLVNLFTFSAFNVKLAVQVYYCQYVLKNISIVPYMGFFSIGCVFIGCALVPTIVKKIGKRHTYMLGCAIWAFGDILAFIFAKDAVVFIAFACFAFFGSSFVNSLNWALVSDAVEYGEWKTGTRSEGVVYSFFTFFRKLAQAVAGFIPAMVLAAVGYVPNAVQSVKAISGIRGLMFIYPSVLAIATIVVMGFFYKLTDDKYREIIVDLNERRNTTAL
ncbi:glycoside-pentoside-hexuronide (GPH):cation symporter [Clostridium frigoris]|uniref:Glycoside-pentoside-hexuronide (GPH):cation symporter n=1 Tax=Clostridium frigoris TaxID=205327 RepID=A0ABS6BWM1_9CLOT|nr:glycoside-pentoside-hexuronide (GPH):cation symporter [Clostridium frigoris]MBU3160994.1 glycoside-pentoside-hexuronide (GPH):cation symporter [Clostridium frigoris]